ncbi:MAG: hypothetical protein E6J53_05515 [Chloroflexi bacterium]|nr:MAG: hypothetical protein E6J53_05515 [Chloroflexota bacterium]
MSALYLALILGVVAAIGIFTTVWSLNPAPPSNADIVEGRLRVYENGLPMSLTEMELQQPFNERVIRPIINGSAVFSSRQCPRKHGSRSTHRCFSPADQVG